MNDLKAMIFSELCKSGFLYGSQSNIWSIPAFKEPRIQKKPKESSTSIFSKPNSKKWTCDVCMAENDQLKAKCFCSDQVGSDTKIEEKPNETLESKTQTSASSGGFSLGMSAIEKKSTSTPLSDFQTAKLPNTIINHEDKITDNSITDLSFKLKNLDIKSKSFSKNETILFPPCDTSTLNTLSFIDSASKAPKGQSLNGLQNLSIHESTSSLGFKNGLFSYPTITANSSLGPTSKTCDRLGSSNQTFNFGENKSPENETINRSWSVFWLPPKELCLGDKSFSDIVNSMKNPLNFTSSPTLYSTNPLSSETSSNLTFFPGLEKSNKENAFFDSDFSSWRRLFGDISPNISFGQTLYINAKESGFNSDLFTQTKISLSDKSNNQSFKFGQAMDINLNFSKSNSNEFIQFSGSNELSKETPIRRFSKPKRRFK